MKFLLQWTLLLPLLLIGSTSYAQEYWEYDEWEQQWERHDPIAGLKYEYGNGIEVEEQAYEWEEGEGYHEEEWYDPSDWFDDDDSVDYENDFDWDFGTGFNLDGDDYNYYEDDYYEEDYYDDYDYDYDYNNGLNDDLDYTFNQQLKGEVVGLKRLRGAFGKPRSVALQVRTDDGQTRTIQLGDRAYADRFLPKFSPGNRVTIGGERVIVDGKNMFRARELRSGVASYRIPAYEYEQKIDGRIVGLRQVRMNNGKVGAIIARVKPDKGAEMNVLLGRPEDLQSSTTTVRPGTEIQVEGYKREVNGSSTFVVQDVTVRSPDSTRPAGDDEANDRQAD